MLIHAHTIHLVSVIITQFIKDVWVIKIPTAYLAVVMIHKQENALHAISLGSSAKMGYVFRILTVQIDNTICMGNVMMLLITALSFNYLVACVLLAMMGILSTQILLEHKHAKKSYLNVNRINI